jgi:hypothetical protein
MTFPHTSDTYIPAALDRPAPSWGCLAYARRVPSTTAGNEGPFNVAHVGRQLHADTGEMYLAADVDNGVASAFRFSVSTTGEWWSDTVVARQRIDGGWDEPVSGGSHGDGWPTPWQPPLEGWDGHHLLIMGSTGLSVEVGEEERELLAVSGFATGVVRHVRVEANGSERLISPALVGAFTVVTVGDGSMRLTALNDNGSTVGPVVDMPM